MDGTCHILGTEQRNHPLDLPPVAEMDDISEASTPVGARRRFLHRMRPEQGDQLIRDGQGRAILYIDGLIQLACPAGLFWNTGLSPRPF